MRLCIFMVGVTDRRSREALIISSLYKQSGLGLTVSLIPNKDSESDLFKQFDNCIKCCTNIIVIDHQFETNEDMIQYKNILNGKYKIQYRITDSGVYNLPEDGDIKRI